MKCFPISHLNIIDNQLKWSHPLLHDISNTVALKEAVHQSTLNPSLHCFYLFLGFLAPRSATSSPNLHLIRSNYHPEISR